MTTHPATTAPGGAEPQPTAGAGATGPGGGHLDPEQQVDVLFLGGQRLPGGDAWLLVTGIDGSPGGEFTAHVLAEDRLSAFGGDVLVLLAPGDPAAGQPPAVGVQVFAVIGGRLIPVAGWPGHDLDGWPEQIRPAVAFAMACSPNWRNTARTWAPRSISARPWPARPPESRCTSPSRQAR